MQIGFFRIKQKEMDYPRHQAAPATKALQEPRAFQKPQHRDAADQLDLTSLFRAIGADSSMEQFPTIEWDDDEEEKMATSSESSEEGSRSRPPSPPPPPPPACPALTPRSKRRMAAERQNLQWHVHSDDESMTERPAKKAFLGIQRVQPHRCLHSLLASRDNASSIDLKEQLDSSHLALAPPVRASSSPGWLQTPEGMEQS